MDPRDTTSLSDDITDTKDNTSLSDNTTGVDPIPLGWKEPSATACNPCTPDSGSSQDCDDSEDNEFVGIGLTLIPHISDGEKGSCSGFSRVKLLLVTF